MHKYGSLTVGIQKCPNVLLERIHQIGFKEVRFVVILASSISVRFIVASLVCVARVYICESEGFRHWNKVRFAYQEALISAFLKNVRIDS